MRKILLLTISLFATMILTAQTPQDKGRGKLDPKERAKRQTEQMTNDLGLNAEQSKKVEALNQKYNDKMQKIIEKKDENDRLKNREEMQVLREEKMKELKLIVTDEQYKKYIEFEKQRVQQRNDKDQQSTRDKPVRRGAPRGE